MGLDSRARRSESVTLQEFVSADTIASEILLEIQAGERNFLLLEGSSDLIFFNSFVNDWEFELKDCRGKKNAIGALTELERRGFVHAFVIADRDFDRFFDGEMTHARLAFYPYNDLECMLFFSNAGARLLKDWYLDCNNLRQMAGSDREIWRIVAETANCWGLVRLYTMKYRLTDYTGSIPLRQALSGKWSEDEIISEFINYLERFFGRDDWAKHELGILKFRELYADEILCKGTDILDIISSLLLSVGGRRGNEANREHLERGMRLAFTAADFEETGLRNWLQQWAGPARTATDG